MTHYATVVALAMALFANGAKRVRFVESTQSRASLASTLSLADWDVKALEALGKIEFENTRNLGAGKSYSHLRVPTGGEGEMHDLTEQVAELVSLSTVSNGAVVVFVPGSTAGVTTIEYEPGAVREVVGRQARHADEGRRGRSREPRALGRLPRAAHHERGDPSVERLVERCLAQGAAGGRRRCHAVAS